MSYWCDKNWLSYSLFSEGKGFYRGCSYGMNWILLATYFYERFEYYNVAIILNWIEKSAGALSTRIQFLQFHSHYLTGGVFLTLRWRNGRVAEERRKADERSGKAIGPRLKQRADRSGEREREIGGNASSRRKMNCENVKQKYSTVLDLLRECSPAVHYSIL